MEGPRADCDCGDVVLYLILIGIVAWGASVGCSYWYGGHEAVTAYQAKEQVAQAKIEDQAKKLIDDAVQKQSEVVAAFDKGRVEGQAQAKVVYVKGAQYAANDKGLSNTQCVMGTDSLLLLNGARADLSTAAAAVAALGLSQPASDQRSIVRGTVPAESAGRGAVSGVQGQPSQLHGPDAVPGNNLSGHPKPTPTK